MNRYSNPGRFFLLFMVLAAPMLAAAYQEPPSGDEIGVAGGGGIINQQFGCSSARFTAGEAAARYRHTFKEGFQVGAYGNYTATKFREWSRTDSDGSTENIDEKNWTHTVAATPYASYVGNRYFGASVGLTYYYSNLNKSITLNGSPVWPSGEIRVGAMDLAYLSVRFMHPNPGLGFDFVGADVVMPFIPYVETSVGVSFYPNRSFSPQLTLKPRFADWIAMPIMVKVDITSQPSFEILGGLEFRF